MGCSGSKQKDPLSEIIYDFKKPGEDGNDVLGNTEPSSVEEQSVEMSSMYDQLNGTVEFLHADNYVINSYLQEGGMGKVYSGMCKSTGARVALKFFGYTMLPPNEQDIVNEIEVMSLLTGTEGIVQLNGIFMDTAEGLISGKNFKAPHPVIVMELVEGGELSDRIYKRKAVSERDLAKMFKRVVRALECLHRRRCIHRDIKLENIMLVGDEEDSPVRLIDFGLMIHLPEGSDEHLCYTLKGTNGCFAPESIISSVYSEKTDIWQAGCTLYSMLSGLAPYDPNAMHQITHGSYFDMTGIGWDNISDSAKDLVRHLLTKDPSERATVPEILEHPWLVDQAPDNDLGEEYVARIKQLALRQKLRTFFLDHKITSDNKDRRENLHKVLPFLRERAESGFEGDEDVDESFNSKLQNLKRMIVKSVSRSQLSGRSVMSSQSKSSFRCSSPVGCHSPGSPSKETRRGDMNRITSGPSSPLRGSRRGDMNFPPDLMACTSNNSAESHHGDVNSSAISEDENNVINAKRHGTLPLKFSRIWSQEVEGRHTIHGHELKHPGLRERSKSERGGMTNETDTAEGEINYAGFVEILLQCGLPELANPAVFSIFDIGSSGTVNIKEFLLTMLAFKPINSDPLEDSNARLYFQIFDINETGYIDLEELKLVVACLLQTCTVDAASYGVTDNSERDTSIPDIEALFEAMDTGKTGRINFEQFKTFYDTVLHHTTLRANTHTCDSA
mmetsp:Transcript_3838/g.5968  ORF Transcript_3838/g.5968 Transcript_3838/m.5968 type:complete len:729 (+) Transcript_3838:136-2322(+)|eukprot:CAMPEP_0185030006 /NCGR_PEP_ID=MMETSP1103-20130426/16719_1 /TAXON_ID=36769 /ORGANISM="Paraphysomonas bandaiensis, Strain Caron Lab Isolate" /LENGTH=728 /DNA_ID=CAMNT_0027564965 /DNA_START=55 /DNA_END=2241 /DNA_ORIENTATION=+